MSKNPSASLREVQGKLIGRAWEDQTFKKTLLKNPVAAIEQATGLKLPAGVQVKVLEETDDTLYLVLPKSPLGAERELSDDTLASVAGGSRGVPTQPGYPDPSCR